METLLLSHGFEPLARVGWEQAIKLWALDKVDIVEAYARQVRSPSMTLDVPSVVRFRYRVPTRRVRPHLSRRALYDRDEGRCVYCGKRLLLREATLDHVMPRCRGGGNTWENLVTACRVCNERKGPRTPREAGMVEPRAEAPRALPAVLCSIDNRPVPQSWQPYLWGRVSTRGGSRSS